MGCIIEARIKENVLHDMIAVAQKAIQDGDYLKASRAALFAAKINQTGWGGAAVSVEILLQEPEAEAIFDQMAETYFDKVYQAMRAKYPPDSAAPASVGNDPDMPF